MLFADLSRVITKYNERMKYRVFQVVRHALLGYGMILGSNQFHAVTEPSTKLLVTAKVVKSDTKIIILLLILSLIREATSLLLV